MKTISSFGGQYVVVTAIADVKRGNYCDIRVGQILRSSNTMQNQVVSSTLKYLDQHDTEVIWHDFPHHDITVEPLIDHIEPLIGQLMEI